MNDCCRKEGSLLELSSSSERLVELRLCVAYSTPEQDSIFPSMSTGGQPPPPSGPPSVFPGAIPLCPPGILPGVAPQLLPAPGPAGGQFGAPAAAGPLGLQPPFSYGRADLIPAGFAPPGAFGPQGGMLMGPSSFLPPRGGGFSNPSNAFALPQPRHLPRFPGDVPNSGSRPWHPQGSGGSAPVTFPGEPEPDHERPPPGSTTPLDLARQHRQVTTTGPVATAALPQPGTMVAPPLPGPRLGAAPPTSTAPLSAFDYGF